jgi:hypothetical protein
VIERQRPEDEPLEGLMRDVAHAHDDMFRWKVAAAVVTVATARLDADKDDAFAKKAIYNWTEVGEVFARFLAVGKGMLPGVPDEIITDAVSTHWDTLKE